jgi:PEP-CTERM motif-containing protein
MRQKVLLAVTAIGCLGLTASPGLAGTVDLSGVVNNDLTTYNNGSVYPQSGGPITIGGIDFNLSTLASGHTGVAQLSADPNGGIQSFTIPVTLSNVGVVYTIVNSAFGAAPDYAGQITFNGLGGETFTYDYIEGDNVRDHATTGFNISAPNVFATDDFGSGDRLDVQQIFLPGSFANDTITSIVFSYDDNVGNTVPGDGEAFLAAITTAPVSAVPEPSTWAMMLIGFAGLGYIGLRQRKRVIVA